jgi:hypothetical protein
LVLVFIFVFLFCPQGVVFRSALDLSSLNIMMRSSPARSRKKNHLNANSLQNVSELPYDVFQEIPDMSF